MGQHPGAVFAQICLLAHLIGPWWKQLDALALRGHRFDTLDELVRTIYQAVAYWNRHRYPYVWDHARRVRLMVPQTMVRSTYQFKIVNTWETDHLAGVPPQSSASLMKSSLH